MKKNKYLVIIIFAILMITCITNPVSYPYIDLFGSWEISYFFRMYDAEASEEVIIDRNNFSIKYTSGPLTDRRFEMNIDTWALVNCEVESIKEQVVASYKITGKVTYRDVDGFTALGVPPNLQTMYLHIKKDGQGMWRSRFNNSAGDGEYSRKN